MIHFRLNWLFALLILASLFSLTISAKEHWADWGDYATIKVTGDNRYKAVFIEPRVYRCAQVDLADLRIVDEQGQFLPYIIQNGSQTVDIKEKAYRSRLINEYETKNDHIYDFQIVPKDPHSDVAGTGLHFEGAESSGEDYLEMLRIFGSYDGEKWQELGEETIYHVKGVSKTTVNFIDRQKYSYYRVKHIGGNQRYHFSLSNLSISLVDESYSQQWFQYQQKAKIAYKINENGDTTEISIANPHKLHLLRLLINADGNFKRRIALTDAQGVGLLGTSPYIYHLEFKDRTVSNTNINLDCSSVYPHLVLKIFNQSDRPLKIHDITALYSQDKLIFIGEKGRTYRLLFGNPKAHKPQYDMELYRESISNESQDLLSISSFSHKKPIHARNHEVSRKALGLYLNIVLGLVACLLVIILVGKLKRKTPVK